MSSSSAGRKNNFDSLRLFFAVLVIFSHSYPLGRGSNSTEPLHVLTHGAITFGNIAVWSFFAISGFLITQSWLRSSSPLSYLKKRVARIYPGFIAAALLSALLVVPVAAEPHAYVPVSLSGFLYHTLRLDIFPFSPLFTHNAWPNILNGSLWSIPFEFWCYIGVLLLGLAGLFRYRPLIVSVFLLVIAARLYMAVTGASPGGGFLGAIFGFPVFWAMVLPYFLAGMLFHLYGGRSLLCTPLVALAAVVIIASSFLPHGLLVTLPICWTYILMWLAYLPALYPLHLGRYGDFSYGVYLYAFPIEQLIVMRWGGHMNPLMLFALATPASLIAGALSWFFIEKRFLTPRTQLKHEGLIANDLSISEASVHEKQQNSASLSMQAVEAYAEYKQ